MDEQLQEQLKQYLAAMAKAAEPKVETPEFATKADVEAAINAAVESLGAKVAEEVQKSLPPVEREAGAGRAGTQATEPTDEEAAKADPVAYAVKAAKNPKELTQDQKDLIWGLTKAVLGAGLRGEE